MGEPTGKRTDGRRTLALSVLVLSAVVVACSIFISASRDRPGSRSSASDNWNRFYASHIGTAYRFAGAFIVLSLALSVISGLVSGLLVKVDAPEWKEEPLRFTRYLGVGIVLFAALSLPGYAMLKNFTPLDVVSNWAWAIVAALVVVTGALFIRSQGRLKYEDDSSPNWRDKAAKNWKPFYCCLLVLGFVVLVFGSGWIPGLGHPTPRLIISYVALSILGVVVTAVSFGQNLKVQIEVKTGDGKRDEGATEYLLARLTTLGLEQQRNVTPGRPSKALGALAESNLSATPAGQIVGTLANIIFAMRPGFTWRIAAAFADDGRLTMTLSRNGRLDAVDVCSRKDLDLAELDRDDPDSVERNRAQLLTGASAFVLHRLSAVYTQSPWGLCGATKWRSTTLEIIATSRSLTGAPEEPLRIVWTATDMDPNNANAQYEYIRALIRWHHGSPFVPLLATRLDELRDMIIKDSEEGPSPAPRPGYERLAPQVLYRSASTWLALAMNHPRDLVENGPRVASAAVSIRMFEDCCDNKDIRNETSDSLKSYMDNLKACVEAFGYDVPQQVAHTSPEPKFSSPSLAYQKACLGALRLVECAPGEPREEALSDVFGDLVFALGTDDMKDAACNDARLRELSKDPRFVILTGPPVPQQFLDLPPFADFKKPLKRACLTTAALFEAATRDIARRGELAGLLDVPTATIDRMAEIAAVGVVSDDLADPRMLYLLQRMKIESLQQLRRALARDRVAFLEELTALAEASSLTDLAGLAPDPGWVQAEEYATLT